MMRKFDINETIDFIKNTSPETRVYIGGDSCRFRKHGVWTAEYTLCVVVHMDGKKGCRLFGYAEHEVDYDQKKNKPRMRLMNEVMKVADLYLKLADAIGDRHCEIHLDLNHDEKYGSNCVVKEAIGYIRGTCNMTPMLKPNSPAASFAADRLVELLQEKAPLAA